jgi:hypothetical protein
MIESNQTPNNAYQLYWVYIIGAWSLIGLLLVAIFWSGMTATKTL